MPAPSTAALSAGTVILVLQARGRPEQAEAFARWQQRLGEAVLHFPGFSDQSSIPPAPPEQVDWVVLQRFDSVDSARGWLQSDEWKNALAEIEPALIGSVDIHLLHGSDARMPSAPVSVLISTQVKAGEEEAFQRWQRRIAVEEAKFPGFQGYRIEPPMPGVQDQWVMAVRFDSDEHLDAWLNSEQRRQLLEQATSFDAGTHIRKIGSGFESWFASGDDTPPPPAWKQNALVLLMLYPFIFLFDALVQRPILQARGMPFWLALFVGDVLGVPLLGYFLVPWSIKGFRWWLGPSPRVSALANWAGGALILLLYGAMVAVFARIP